MGCPPWRTACAVLLVLVASVLGSTPAAQPNATVAFHTFDVTQSGCTLSHTVAHLLVEFGAPLVVVRDPAATGEDTAAPDGAVNTDQHNAYGLTRLECDGGVVLPSHPDAPKRRRVFPDFVVPRRHAELFPGTRLGNALRAGTRGGTPAWQSEFEAQLVVDVATVGECPRRLVTLVRSLSAHAGAGRSAGAALAGGRCRLQFLPKSDQTWLPAGQLVTRTPHDRRAVAGDFPLTPSPAKFLHAASQDDGATNVHTLNLAQDVWREYLKAADAFAGVAAASDASSTSSAPTVLLEQAPPLLLLEEDTGQCSPASFVELDAEGMIPGLSALLDPVIEAVMAPVNAILGGVLGSTLGAALSNMLGKSVNEGLTDEVTVLLTNSVVPALTQSLVPVLTETISDQVTHHFSASLRDDVVKRVVSALTHSLTKSVTQELGESVPAQLDATLPDKLAESLSRTLTSVLTRSVAQSVVPALTNTFFHTPQQDYYCSLCKTHQRYCELCVSAPKQLPQAEYYASYYSAYYAQYFAGSVSKQKHKMVIT